VARGSHHVRARWGAAGPPTGLHHRLWQQYTTARVALASVVGRSRVNISREKVLSSAKRISKGARLQRRCDLGVGNEAPQWTHEQTVCPHTMESIRFINQDRTDGCDALSNQDCLSYNKVTKNDS
jgi:hypothetical protein